MSVDHPLDELRLHARTLAAVSAHVQAGRLSSETVAARVHELFHQLSRA